jgi:hypothetical protein
MPRQPLASALPATKNIEEKATINVFNLIVVISNPLT